MRRRCTDWNARRRPRRLDASLTEQQENLGEVCDLSCLGEVVVGHDYNCSSRALEARLTMTWCWWTSVAAREDLDWEWQI